MKRYLLYIAIISLGTLLTPSALAKPISTRSTIVASNVVVTQQITAPSQVKTIAIDTPIVPQVQSTAPTVSTQPVAPVVKVPVPPPPSYPTDHVAIMQAAGVSSNDFSYVDYILTHESGWCAFKWEGEYGSCPSSFSDFYGTPNDIYWTSKGYGLCQSTPAVKMASAGADWQSNPVTQMKWCSNYASSRYGGWYNAYLYWSSHRNW